MSGFDSGTLGLTLSSYPPDSNQEQRVETLPDSFTNFLKLFELFNKKTFEKRRL